MLINLNSKLHSGSVGMQNSASVIFYGEIINFSLHSLSTPRLLVYYTPRYWWEFSKYFSHTTAFISRTTIWKLWKDGARAQGKFLERNLPFLEHEEKKKLFAKNNVHKSSPYFLPNDDLFTILVVSFSLVCLRHHQSSSSPLSGSRHYNIIIKTRMVFWKFIHSESEKMENEKLARRTVRSARLSWCLDTLNFRLS